MKMSKDSYSQSEKVLAAFGSDEMVASVSGDVISIGTQSFSIADILQALWYAESIIKIMVKSVDEAQNWLRSNYPDVDPDNGLSLDELIGMIDYYNENGYDND